MVQQWNFDKDTYLKNRAIFIRLIHHTGKKLDVSQDGGCEFAKLMELVFGGNPCKKNLIQFFRLEVIQELLWPKDGSMPFFYSEDYLSLFNTDEEYKGLTNLLNKVIPPEFVI